MVGEKEEGGVGVVKAKMMAPSVRCLLLILHSFGFGVYCVPVRKKIGEILAGEDLLDPLLVNWYGARVGGSKNS